MPTTIANTILAQLGGRRFTVMTGCSMYLADGNTLRMKLARNLSGANKLHITLTGMDDYTLEFYKLTAPGFRRGAFHEGSTRLVKKVEGVYADQLQAVFTEVTGLETRL